MDNVFTLCLHDFRISAIIGALPKERENPQEIVLDIDIIYARGEILDYGLIYDFVREIFAKNHFVYLEDTLTHTINALVERFSGILDVSVSIAKPHILPLCKASVRAHRTLIDSRGRT